MERSIVTHITFALALVLTITVNSSSADYGPRYLTTDPEPPIPATGVSTNSNKTVANPCSVTRDPAHSIQLVLGHGLIPVNDKHWGDFVFRVDRPINITSFDFFGNGDKAVGPLAFQLRLWESPGWWYFNSNLMLNIDATLNYDPVKPGNGELMRIFTQQEIPTLIGGDKYQYTIEFRFGGEILFAKRTQEHYGTQVVTCTGIPVKFEFYESGNDFSGVWQLPVINFEIYEGELTPDGEPATDISHVRRTSVAFNY